MIIPESVKALVETGPNAHGKTVPDQPTLSPVPKRFPRISRWAIIAPGSPGLPVGMPDKGC